MKKRSIIISIGDELVLGQVVDTNAAWLGARMAELGMAPLYHQAVPDDKGAIAFALKTAADRADFVMVSGGLGPTRDDLTRQAAALAAGVRLVRHAPTLGALESYFKNRGWTMSANNAVQAMFPAGAAILDNPCGTAPGFKMRLGRAVIAVVPGVPREMKAMFEKHIEPLLAAMAGGAIAVMKLNVFGMGESLVDQRLGALMRRGRNPLVGTTVADGVVSVRIRGEYVSRTRASLEVRKTAARVRRLLGKHVFGEGDDTLAAVVGRMLAAQHKTLATAESCTAGLLAAMLTEVPGASAYFLGGWVVYSNRMKEMNLAVPGTLIASQGAVSRAVAERLAEGALSKSGADYALSITGIAGPSGGSDEKPVGTVWIALAEKTGRGNHVAAQKYMFPRDRASIRERAAKSALNMLRLRLMGSFRP